MQTKTNANVGLMADSVDHIARLESKLQRLKNKNQNGKISGKELISSIKEFNQIYMYDYLKNDNKSQISESFQNTGNIPLNYLERKILPEQPVNIEETLNLVENDCLSKSLLKEEDSLY